MESVWTDGAAGTPGSSSQCEKTTSTLKQNHGDCTTKITWANDKMAGEGKGKLVDEDGWKVDLTGAAEIKQAKSEWKVTGKLDIQTPDMGGAKSAINVSISLRRPWLFLQNRRARMRLTGGNSSASSTLVGEIKLR